LQSGHDLTNDDAKWDGRENESAVAPGRRRLLLFSNVKSVKITSDKEKRHLAEGRMRSKFTLLENLK
jgi:hypothetical protein